MKKKKHTKKTKPRRRTNCVKFRKARQQKATGDKPVIRLNKKLVAKALLNSYGIISVIARRCRVGRKYIYRFLAKEENAEFKEMLEFESEGTLDLSEEQLIKSLKKREAWAIKFNLSTKGRKRGYGYKLDLDLKDKSLNLEGIWLKLQNDKKNLKRSEYLRRLASGEDPQTVLIEYERFQNSGVRTA